ncbi:MAG: hypothetical protein ACRDJN_13325 [Chloroflexota bacterium]
MDQAGRQVCWAHLKRDFQGLVDRGGAARPRGTATLALVHDRFARFAAWHQYRAPSGERVTGTS